MDAPLPQPTVDAGSQRIDHVALEPSPSHDHRNARVGMCVCAYRIQCELESAT